MRGAKYILALTLAMAGASALAHNGGYENGNLVDVAGYAGYGEDTTETATPTGDDALTMLYAQCKALKSLDLSQVGAIGDAAFAYSAVTSIVLTANISSVGYISFGGCSNLTEVSCDSWNWANGTANIEDKEPFRDCFKLTTLRVSGDAASPPESFSVTNTFDVLTTVYCPTSTVSAWEAAYPSLTIIGDPELAPSPAPAPAPVHTLLSLTNGTVSAAFSLPSPDDADAHAERLCFTENFVDDSPPFIRKSRGIALYGFAEAAACFGRVLFGTMVHKVDLNARNAVLCKLFELPCNTVAVELIAVPPIKRNVAVSFRRSYKIKIFHS